MTPTPTPTPTEELEIRQHCANVWSLTWANATELTPEQAFTEGHLLAFWCGVVAGREIQLKAKRQIQRLETALALVLLAVLAAIALPGAR
jgi:hypothetical protein